MKSKLRKYKDAIESEYAEGATQDALAEKYGVARSTMQGFISYHKFPKPDPDLEVHEGPSREEILKHEVKDLRAALSKQRRTVVADERLIRSIEKAVEDAPIKEVPRVNITRIKSGKNRHHRAMLLLSDFHGGEVVDPTVVNGLNEYDWDIMEARVDELLSGIKSHIRRMPELTGIDVGFLGDMNSGANHDEIKETNQFNMADQSIKMAYLQARILGEVAALVPDLQVFAVEGNHPRLEKKPAAKSPHNNMDYVSAVFTSEMVKNVANLSKFEIGRGSLIWEIANRKCYVFHGDGIRTSMPGVPWGGVMRRTNTLQASYPFTIDHFLLGHFHQANVVQGGRIIGNGSLKGCDEWTLKNFGGGDPPCQLLLAFDEKASRLTSVRYLTPEIGLS